MPHPGLHESLLTAALARLLPEDTAHTRPLTASESARRLATHFGDHLHRVLASLPAKERPANQVALVNELLAVIDAHTTSFPLTDDAVRPELLTAIGPPETLPARPQLPLSESGLYVNANRERSLDVALRLECESADRVDLICAFLFWAGYARIRKTIQRHLELGRPLRVLTTTYCASTDARVLDELSDLGADVRVSYQTASTRLHAKAWLFHRDSGFSTAFVGSSNLSATALTLGREWNVRLSQIENRAVLGELAATFENHWSDDDFVPYEPITFREAIRAERPKGELTRVFDLRPRTFQQVILDRLDTERTLHDRHKNLIVSATGTGKTVVAALDYARLCAQAGKRLKLLFVAHRREILDQSRDTFHHAVSDGSFGERFVDGDRPLDWDHVFASVQSLAQQDLSQWAPDAFDVLIIDEFHHAAADTYQRVLNHFTPTELVGLTATPERADGKSVLEWFDGRIASELRIWDAIDRGLLVPFQYFGIRDGVDLTSVWKRGRYDLSALQNLYTGHHLRAHLIVNAIAEHVHDATRMRALAFCVGVDHAVFMEQAFTKAGIPCAVVTGTTSKVDRRRAVTDLRNGDIACILTVDVFNEGVDIPEVDTVLFLRPTESATVFLQQLGRGLRTHEGKRCVTVFDFVGLAHERFRYVDRFRALLGPVSRKSLQTQVEQDFPYLPAGCAIQLDRESKEVVLDNVAKGLRLNKRSLAHELRESGATTLSAFLTATDLQLDELYRSGRTFSELARIAGVSTPPPGPNESKVARGVARLLHVDDTARLQAWQTWLAGGDAPSTELQTMLLTTLFGRDGAPMSDLRAEPAMVSELRALLALLADRLTHQTLPWLHRSRVPLQVHGTYRLNEIMAAFDDVRDGSLYLPREGVYFNAKTQCNLLFVTLHKDEDDYSATTMYADYALSPTRFHWQSQSGTRPTDVKGQRHVHHADTGITPLLFVRERKKDDRNETVPYTFLGPVSLVRAEGERPMNIEWALDTPMPAALLQQSKVVA